MGTGELTLSVPKLRVVDVPTQIIKCCRRREPRVEETMMEIFFAGVSTRRIEDVREASCGFSLSKDTFSNLNKKLFATVVAWRTRRLASSYLYVCVDGTYPEKNWSGVCESMAALIEISESLQSRAGRSTRFPRLYVPALHHAVQL